MGKLLVLVALVAVALLPDALEALECRAKNIRKGGCPQFSKTFLPPSFAKLSAEQCEEKCLKNKKCEGFVMKTKGTSHCYLMKAGCTQGGNKDKFTYYETVRCSCTKNPCENGGKCVSGGPNKVKCSCKKGWKGDTCTEDVNECKLRNIKCNPATSVCKNTPGGYACSCKSGYVLARNSNTHCIDVDECARGSDTCNKQNSVCENTQGGFKCQCQPGFTSAPGNKCVACSKTKSGKKCVFPFKYGRRTYNSCTGDGIGKNKFGQDNLWCATALRSNGKYATWEICDLACFKGK